MKKAGIDEGDIDEGCVEISSPETAASFVKICRKLRYWDRAAAVK
jgi:catalase